MLPRAMWLKCTVAISVYAVSYVAWATIGDPTPGDHYGTTADITITGQDTSNKGQSGTINAYENSLGGTKVQTCPFYTNATTGEFQQSSSDTTKPVLEAPPWNAGLNRIYIQAMLDSGTSAGLTYVWID